jgi:hypothetical protein
MALVSRGSGYRSPANSRKEAAEMYIGGGALLIILIILLLIFFL